MMSATLIKSISDHAAYRAAQEDRYPLFIESDEDAHHIPFLGPYVPQGWRPVEEPLMVDSSGFGSPGELALTFDQFLTHIRRWDRAAYGWAIIETGQFQVVVQAYVEDPDAPGAEAPEPDPCEYCGEVHDDLTECDPYLLSRCPACGDVIDYCQGHGEMGDPAGFAILQAHDDDDHSGCHPDGCDEAEEGTR